MANLYMVTERKKYSVPPAPHYTINELIVETGHIGPKLWRGEGMWEQFEGLEGWIQTSFVAETVVLV